MTANGMLKMQIRPPGVARKISRGGKEITNDPSLSL